MELFAYIFFPLMVMLKCGWHNKIAAYGAWGFVWLV